MNHNEIILASSLECERLAMHESSIYKNTHHGKASEKAAKSLIRIIKRGIESNNVSTLLKIEENAINCDINSYGAAEKRTS